MAEVKITRAEYEKWKSQGGTVQTMPPGLLEYLRTRGIDPVEYAQAVDPFTEGLMLLGGETPDSAAITERAKEIEDSIINDAVGDAGQARDREAREVLDKAIEEQKQTGQVSEETQAEAAQAGVTPQLQSLINANAAREQGATMLPWVMSELPGVDATQIDLVALFDHTNSMFSVDWMERDDLMTDDEYKRLAVMQLFRSQNDLTTAAVRTFAEEQELHASQLVDGGISVGTITDVADKYGVQYREAKVLGIAGKVNGLEIDDAVSVYKWAKDTGIDMRELPLNKRRKRVAGGGPYPGYDSYKDVDVSMEETSGYYDGGPYPGYYSGVGGTVDIVPTAGEVQRMYRKALDQYSGSVSVARVAMHSPDLAQRMFDDPYSLSIEEIREIDKMIGGVQSIADKDPAGASWLMDRMLGSSPTKVTVNKDGIREAAKTLAASWNMTGLSDAQLDQIVNTVVGPQIAAARQSLGNPFNPKFNDGLNVINTPDALSAAKNKLRGTAEYRDLFGNLRAGETEEEYAGRFLGESEQLLGDTDPGLARAGMRSGDRNTVGQAILASGRGTDSSVFQQRLSRLGEAFRSMT